MKNLVEQKFLTFTYEDKIKIKEAGRPLPDLKLEVAGRSRGKSYTRRFNREIYDRNSWICGCDNLNALFCFPCILFDGEKTWSKIGVTDLVHLSEKIIKHEKSKQHLNNQTQLALLGTVNIQSQLDSAYWASIQKHNENVTKNRYVLSKIINCIKFCGAFELAIRGHDESADSCNPGIFRGLIDFSADLDQTLKEHLQTSTQFTGTSKTIQNELLDSMLAIARETISHELVNARFVAIISDETTDTSAKCQMVLVFRYVKDSNPVERFWGFLSPKKHDSDSFSSIILQEIDPIIPTDKLIAQCYDGASVMSGKHGGVQAKIKNKYPNAHFLHCYAHQFNLIMQQACSQNKQVRVFFANLHEIPSFFSHSPQRVAVLDKMVDKRVPRSAPTRWNFNSRTVNMVFEYRSELIECMHQIQEEFHQTNVINQASAIERMLENDIFIFWLTLFHHIMPHVDILFNQLQKKKIDPCFVRKAVDNFENSIVKLRERIDKIIEEATNLSTFNIEISTKRKRTEDIASLRRIAAIEICDVITYTVRSRFQFTGHLIASKLLVPEHFPVFEKQFPTDELSAAVINYPFLEKERLKTELSVIYEREEFRSIQGLTPLLNFLRQHNLLDNFKETVKLLEILVTTPMTTAEAERCFSTLKRVKTFLRSTMCQERLNALAMLSVERDSVANIPNFNEKVIEHFAYQKERRMDFIYKR